jgi:hypothetical protein
MQESNNKQLRPPPVLSADSNRDEILGVLRWASIQAKLNDPQILQEISAYDQILNYEPDWIVYRDLDNESWTDLQVTQFLKTQRASVLARVWTEMLKQVCWDNRISTRFHAGFLFDSKTEAFRIAKTGSSEIMYLVNPIFVPSFGVQNKIPFVNWMRTTAVHELTHHFVKGHDESFTQRYHQLEANTWPSHRIYAHIGSIR